VAHYLRKIRALDSHRRPASSGFGEPAGGSSPALPAAYLSRDAQRRWLRVLLPGAFVALWILNLAVGFEWRTLGLDARIYYHGSAAWLAGQDPWSAGAYLGERLFSYAGLPPTTILLAPLTVLPEELFVWLWLVLSVVAAIVVVRTLRLPLAWMTYPPLLYGVLAANPHVVVLALVLAGGTGGGALAAILKVVAVPPLVGERRWRAIGLATVAIMATILFAPGLWTSFLHQAGTVADAIHAESGGGVSAWGQPVLFPATVAALALLALVDLRAACWLAVPALFPTTQYYYAMFALPVDPFLAAAMAFPWPGVPALVTIAYAVVRLVLVMRRRSRRARRLPPLDQNPG
jgi:hypothetical protein